jgi:hypothetical protein
MIVPSNTSTMAAKTAAALATIRRMDRDLRRPCRAAALIFGGATSIGRRDTAISNSLGHAAKRENAGAVPERHNPVIGSRSC